MATTITHFSHPHDLVLTPSTKVDPTMVDPVYGVICSFCQTVERTGKEVYACSSPSCGYVLDPTCASLKEQLLIPAHNHVLDLVTGSPTPGTIACKACGGWILNNRYSCSYGKTCGYDVHSWCAKVPEKLDSKFHEHTLYLHFPAPQRDGSHGFRCGQCGQGDQGLWGYTCEVCENGFFLHLDCNVFKPPPPPTSSHRRGIHIFHRNKKKDDDGNNNELAHEEEEAHHHHTKKIVAEAGAFMHKAGKIFKHSRKNQNGDEAAAEEETEAGTEEETETEVEEAEVGQDEEGASGISELFSTVLEFLGSVGE